jgi:NADPH2:quinone reductase
MRVYGGRVLGVIAAALGGPEVLRVTELPEPEAQPGQVVVRIRAVCVHPADVAATTGVIPRGPVMPPFLPGWDIAGEVASVGPATTDFRVGDRVVGMIPWYLTRGAPGGYAEFVAADADWLVPLPDELDFATAATVPLNVQTAHQGLALLSSGLLSPGSSVLVTGASGGVGGFATQLATQGGYRVLAQASHGDEEWVRGLGPHDVIPRSADLATVGPVAAVFDAVPIGEAAAAAVENRGVVVFTRPTPAIDPARGVRQDLQLIRLDRKLLAELVRQVAAGKLRTRVAATMPLTEAADAHRRVLAGGVRGKVVLTSG